MQYKSPGRGGDWKHILTKSRSKLKLWEGENKGIHLKLSLSAKKNEWTSKNNSFVNNETSWKAYLSIYLSYKFLKLVNIWSSSFKPFLHLAVSSNPDKFSTLIKTELEKVDLSNPIIYNRTLLKVKIQENNITSITSEIFNLFVTRSIGSPPSWRLNLQWSVFISIQ